jgi:cytochrome P450
MEIPNFFSGQEKIMSFDFDSLKDLLDTDIDHSSFIENLSLDSSLVSSYFKSILLGYNHIFISKLLQQYGESSNICLPLFNQWSESNKHMIDNLVIISHPDDAERICKTHIKKAPIFKSLLGTSIISTTDNDDWKEQRDEMNMAFLPNTSLKNVFPDSVKRAKDCLKVLKDSSDNYQQSVDMSDFFLNETQAQLQKAMFGFSDKFEENSNKRIRNAFVGIETEYLEEFSKTALKEAIQSDGPASKLFHRSDDKDLEKALGNMILFAFAGHDTTGHTLSWLLYELCKHPENKQRLIEEVDEYWRNNDGVENYETFDQLPFMTQCITETLRMWPALANGTYRELERDDKITGLNGEKVLVKKGTYCQIINWTRHRNSELWGDDVNEFNPDREFKGSEIWDYKGFGHYNVSSERFSPFTYGPRNCLGKNFSQMEMRLILLNIFKDHDFSLDSEQEKTVNDPKYSGFNIFTMGPQSVYDGLLGMFMNVHKRKSNL